MAISRDLQFNSKCDPRAATAHAWKLRRVVTTMQQPFKRGYVAPTELSFDEAKLPSRSLFNKERKKQHASDVATLDFKSGPAPADWILPPVIFGSSFRLTCIIQVSALTLRSYPVLCIQV